MQIALCIIIAYNHARWRGAGVISEYMTSALEGLEWGWGAENVPIYKAIMAGIFSLGENRIYDLCRL